MDFEIKNIWYFAIAAVACYVIGCFNFAVLIAHIKKKDIREMGSGNPGTMNMTRSLGLKFGSINFFCDVCKCGFPVLAGYFIFKGCVFAGTDIAVSDFARYFFGLFVIIGHIFPANMKFKGGKGIASTMGIFLFGLPCENWWYVFVVIGFLIAIFLYITFTEWGSMGSLIGITLPTVFQAAIFAVRYSDNLINGWCISIFVILLAINLLSWVAHRKNIVRLLAGEEHRTVVRKNK